MGGLGVISAGFLAAGAALAAVPIVIHLLFRRKATRIDIGSLRFLKIAIRDNAHRRRIRRWLLLALRVGGVLLLALLFARPYLSEPEVPGSEREVAILVDQSASMEAGSPTRSSFTRAHDAASKLLKGLPEGTSVHLATFDETGVEPIASDTFANTKKRPGSAGTDFSKAIAWAGDKVVQSRRKLREIYLFTDLQRSGLDHPSRDDFPEGVKIDVVDVGRTIKANLAVVDSRAVRTEIRPDSPLLLSATILNAGSFTASDVEVRLTLEGGGETFRLSEKITIDGSARREVRFSPAIRKPNHYRGSIEVVSDDELPFDNKRWLAFDAKAPETVLLVDGSPGSTPFANETYYLESAIRLRLPEVGPSATPYEPRRIEWEGGTRWPSLTETKVVVLTNVTDVPPDVANSLKAFVEAGGRLVIFSGDRITGTNLDSLKNVGLLPAEIEGSIGGSFRFIAWKEDHPLLGPFADPQHGDLRTLLFSQISRLKPIQGSVVLASTNDGQPLLVESSLGKGRIMQWAVPANNEWGDWAIQRLYLPMIHQMMGYLTGRLSGTGPIREVPIEPNTSPGIEVTKDGMLVRNTDPAESQIERATPAEFRSSLRLPALEIKRESEGGGKIEIPEGSLRPGELWRPVAWALLIFLVAETFLANRTSA